MTNLGPTNVPRILVALVESCGLESVRVLEKTAGGTWWRDRSVGVAVEGELTVGSFRILLRVGLPPRFPQCLPEIAVAKCTPEMALPHVADDGKLCFAAEDGLVLDRRDWSGVLRESLELARATLAVSTGPDRGKEFLNEIVAHWRDLAKRRVRCVVEADDRPRQIIAFYDKRDLVAVADDQASLGLLSAKRAAAGYTNRTAVYLPVEVLAEPTFEPRHLLELSNLRSTVARVPELAKILKDLNRRDEVFVLGISRPTGGRALVVIEARGDGAHHPLVGGQASLTPFSCERGDKALLAPRGGADASLSSAQVLLIGCGSVGGHIAMGLARAGIGEICLVDGDTFELGNAYRHVCGMAYVGQAKTTGLAAEMRRLVPHMVITEETCRIEDLLSRRTFKLQKFDLVVCAIGSPTVELQLNEAVWGEKGPPSLFAWLEPLGLGRHVTLTNPRQGVSGCLECLWPSVPIRNRSAFAASGVTYTADLLGCGSRYVPFADLDAERLAISVCRLALAVISTPEAGPRLFSGKGDPTTFRAKGFETTARFALTQEQLDANSQAFSRPDCPVCGVQA